MLIYTDELKLHRRQLHLKTNKPNAVQMSELLTSASPDSTRFHRETEGILTVEYEISN